MRSTYGNKLGGVPRSNIQVPADEIRYSPILKTDGTRDKLLDWQLYFKKEEDGGILPEYKTDQLRTAETGATELNESGEFDWGGIFYAFRDIRLVPYYDESNNRSTKEIGGDTIPGKWDLVADLYLYLKRDAVIPSRGSEVITEYFSGIIQSDILLTDGELEYSLKPCDNGRNYVDWYYKFDVDSIEALPNVTFKQLSKNTGESVEIRDRILKEITISGQPSKIVPLARRGTVPKGQGVLPLSGEYIPSQDEEVTWDGFTPDANTMRFFQPSTPAAPAVQEQAKDWMEALKRIVLNALRNAGIEKHDRPITQSIVWQTIWKAWSGAKYDGVSIDITDPRLDDDSTHYDGVFLPLEADGHPIESEFATNYYLPRSAKWLRVSKKLMDGAYPNIGRGKTKCVDVLPPNDCTKVPFKLVDAKRRIDSESYKFISKDTSTYRPIPGQPCYQGLPATYERTAVYEYTSSKDCFDGKVDSNGVLTGETKTLYSYSMKTEVENVVEWENIIRNSIAATCECYELSVQNPPCIDPNDPDGCNIMYTDTIYTICPDDGPYYYNNREIPPNAVPTRLEIRYISDHECQDNTKIAAYHSIKMEKDVLNAIPTIFNDGNFNFPMQMVTKKFEVKSYNTWRSLIFNWLNSELEWGDVEFTESYETIEGSPKCYLDPLQDEYSKKYYSNVIATNQFDKSIKFSLAYANKNGFGSEILGSRQSDAISKLIYGQYKSILTENDTREFIFYDNGIKNESPNDFYIINFDNDTIKDRIDVGNFQLNLMDLENENNILSFIDNSFDLANNMYYSESPYFSFQLISGSLTRGPHSSGVGDAKTNTSFTTYGEVYPNLGIVVLDSDKLNSELNFTTITDSNVFANNEMNLFTSISGAMSIGYPIQIRSSERKVSNHYFVRVAANEANYSNNPTFYDRSNGGKIINGGFAHNPVTFITSIGLYNDNNELLAIAKLSKPLRKNRDSELLVGIKLTI